MLSGIVTVVLLVLFLAVCIWAFSPRRKRDFDAAARLPLTDDRIDLTEGAKRRERQHAGGRENASGHEETRQ